jgi:hypothetical protein
MADNHSNNQHKYGAGGYSELDIIEASGDGMFFEYKNHITSSPFNT